MIDERIQMMLYNEDQFSDEFFGWFPNNEHIYDAFQHETMKIIRKGYKHYSGRTILEVLRHHSALSEDGIWKLNNNHTPYLCRLFALMNPRYSDIFEYRTVKKPKLRLEK
jgi:flavorubredoxin